MTAHAIMFHHFHDDRHPAGQGAISADDLDRLLRAVGVGRILPADEWQRRALTGTLRDDDIALSFDDALLCQYEIALPVLRSYGLTAFWFVFSAPFEGVPSKMEIYRYYRTVCFDSVEQFYVAFNEMLHTSPMRAEIARALKDFDPASYLRDFSFYSAGDRQFRYLRDIVLGPRRYEDVMDSMVLAAGLDVADLAALLWMNDNHLRVLDRGGHIVGLHSYTHATALTSLPVLEQAHEYQANFNHLSRVLSAPPQTVAHPCNSYNADTFRILQDLGVKIGFCSNMVARPWSLLELPRQDHTVLMRQIRQG